MKGGAHRAVLAASAAATFLLGACAATPHQDGKYSTEQSATGLRSGIYKIGEPYQINGVWYYPAEDYNYVETGIASFYGGETRGTNFHGRQTANGELYDMNGLTAAHRTLPLPSLVRVTNLENGRAIELRVNDRGPFARGRILDVSRRAAQLLGFEQQGTARVQVEILAQESLALKEAMLGRQRPPETQVVAAVPREAVASDALPPPEGARATERAVTALPPPSATLPPVSASASDGGTGRRSRPAQQPGARPAPPVVAQPAPAALGQGAPQPGAPQPARVSARGGGTAPASGPVVTQVPVEPTSIFVQAGAFANYDNAYRLSVRLSRYGRTKVAAIMSGTQQLFRVRVGPVNTVQEADSLLAQVATVVPEAQIVVD